MIFRLRNPLRAGGVRTRLSFIFFFLKKKSTIYRTLESIVLAFVPVEPTDITD